MPLVPLNTPLFYPPQAGAPLTFPSFSTQSISTANHAVGQIFQATISGDITHVAFRTGSVNAGTVTVSVETMDTATGYPTGTLWAAGTSNTQAILSTDDNTYFEVALTNPATVTEGDFVCLVVTNTGGTSVNAMTNSGAANSSTDSGYMPVPVRFTGTWSQNPGCAAMIVPKFDTFGYVPMDWFWPCNSATARVYSTASTPDVRGNKITVPYSCTVRDVWLCGDFDGDGTISLLADDGSTILAVASIYESVPPTTGQSKINIRLSTSVNLTAGQVVYLVAEPSSANTITLYEYAFSISGIKTVWCDGAIAVSAKDPTGAGDYTETADNAYALGLVISHIDTGPLINSGLHPIEQGISA